MNQALRKDAQQILASSLQAVLPDEAVQRALRDFEPHGGRVLLVAAGKAAWQMAAAAVRTLGRVDGGVVVTKYHHVKGDIPGVSAAKADTRCRTKAALPLPEKRTGAGAGPDRCRRCAVPAVRRRQCPV